MWTVFQTFFSLFSSGETFYPNFSLIRPGRCKASHYRLGYCNSAINPVIYGLFSREFRAAFKKIICKFFCKVSFLVFGFNIFFRNIPKSILFWIQFILHISFFFSDDQIDMEYKWNCQGRKDYEDIFKKDKMNIIFCGQNG